MDTKNIKEGNIVDVLRYKIQDDKYITLVNTKGEGVKLEFMPLTSWKVIFVKPSYFSGQYYGYISLIIKNVDKIGYRKESIHFYPKRGDEEIEEKIIKEISDLFYQYI